MRRFELILILLCSVTLTALAQNINPLMLSTQELESQRIDAMKAIELTSQLLNETSVSAKSSINRLNLLSKQLLSRRKVVSILGQEIAVLDRQIKTMTDDIEILNKDFEKTKENYTKTMQYQQKESRSNQHKLLLILSAENLSQSFRRFRYLREYANWQKVEAERIVTKQEELLRRKADLEKTRKDKQNLLDQRENENKVLVSEEQQQKKEVRELNSKQKELQRLLTQKRKEAEALNRQIERLIEEDLKNAEKNRTAVVTEKKTEPPIARTPESANVRKVDSTNIRTPENTNGRTGESTIARSRENTHVPLMLESEAVLSRDFTNNKGKLPYPLTGKYTIVSSFGLQQHQELTHVRTNNNGIDIQTTAGADACAVFKGIVTRIFVMPGYNNNVIIRHGDYLTVYSNLSQVYVRAGDVVSSRQSIGKIYTDKEKGNETILHFQIWKERTKLNPALWIR